MKPIEKIMRTAPVIPVLVIRDVAHARPVAEALVAGGLRVPEVITLTGFERLPSAVVAFSRRNIYKRDHYTCQYCGTQPGSEELTIDHVVPRAQGGESRWDNCVLACVTCNKHKADRTPEEARMPLLYLPYVPSRFEAFLLEGRHIRADVHVWLASRLPKGSRLS